MVSSVGHPGHADGRTRVAPSWQMRSQAPLEPNSPDCCPATSPLTAAQHLPPRLGQHVADLVQQLVRLIDPSRGTGAATRLAVTLLPLADAGEDAGDLGDGRHGLRPRGRIAGRQ